MVARIKAIKPTRRFLGDINALEDEMELALDEAADETLELYAKTVKTWRTKVNFTARKTKLGRSIWANNTIYKYVDKGTKPHVIRAKRAPNLRFLSQGFKAKTTPGVIGSMAGAPADSGWVTKKSVNHPGTEARGFSEAIEKKMRKRYYTITRRRLKGLFAPRGK